MREIRDKRGMRGYTALEEKRDACLCPTIRNRGEATSVARPPKKGGWKSGIKFALPRYRKSSVRRERESSKSRPKQKTMTDSSDWDALYFPDFRGRKSLLTFIYLYTCGNVKGEKLKSNIPKALFRKIHFWKLEKKPKLLPSTFSKFFSGYGIKNIETFFSRGYLDQF